MGSCNGCELEIHALNNPYYDIEGLGIRFVASPRHADMLLVTGPLTLNIFLSASRYQSAAPIDILRGIFAALRVKSTMLAP
jgi:Ni,Fe-hydrogenase III small subunit